jgi:signal transduction histidine kinase
MAHSSSHFKVHPSVVYQLGESLISDAMQAIIELVKNSYDADASYSKVVIDTQGITKPEDSYFKDETGGIITIEDDGCGMSLDDLNDGWLTISNRHKLETKKNKQITTKGRTPLGDKGLGRLGVQKLGKQIEIYTKMKGKQGYHMGFSWLDFASTEKLEDVEIQLNEVNYSKLHGTKILITGLMEPELWKDTPPEKVEKKGKGKNKQISIIEQLKNELSRLISPYKEIRDFTVYIELDGKGIDLIEVSELDRNNALMRYKINFDGKYLHVSGKAKLNYFFPNTREDQKYFYKLILNDDGNRFYDYLKKQKFAIDCNLTRSYSKKWFLEFSIKLEFSNIDHIEYMDIEDDKKKIANPGSFFGEIDSYNLKDDEHHIFDHKSEFKKVIKEISGIRIFRDGFAIRIDHDWLNLGKQWTSGSSYYGLKPLNTLGFISLKAQENMDLEETTDREGFKNTLYYRNFYSLLQLFVSFTSNIQENLRRSWLNFRNDYKEADSNIDSQDAVEDITYRIKQKIADASNYEKNIAVLKEHIINGKSESKLSETNIALNRLTEYFKELNSLKELPSIIDERFANLERQIEMMYESVALGLTAEALSHEINNIIDQLARRSKAAKIELGKQDIVDHHAMFLFIEYVNTAALALQKQMAFLSPTLRYVREKRHEIVLDVFVKELIEYFKERWENIPIDIMASFSEKKPFRIRTNKGKLIQIIDNLILNSEYWLKEDIKNGKIKKGIINLDIKPPYILISDNGRGIDPHIENTVFEPFISTKINGRGLGLFIVKQLLASEGCEIELLPERNKKKCLFIFQIDLSGIINE